MRRLNSVYLGQTFEIDGKAYELRPSREANKATQIARRGLCFVMPTLTATFIGAFVAALLLPQPSRSRMALVGMGSLIAFGAGCGVLVATDDD